jgi:site-specific DNA-methyltransferase (adenine-specific)/adenine-specific DNA-methyltransferase
MASLLDGHAGRVNLIYVDPPFATGNGYLQRVPVGAATAAGGARSRLTPAYRDTWGTGRAAYLQMLYERLTLMHALLADGGALYVHVSPSVSHYVKVLLDEVFGPEGFQREIVWRIGWVSGYKSAAANWARNHDTILYYAKGPPAVFNKQYVPYPAGYRRRAGAAGRAPGYPVEDVWNANPAEHALAGADSLDSIQIKSFSREKTGFPTQKNESLLRRIIRASSREGDLVADFFCGSGTTLAVAQQLGRRWLGCDESWPAIHTTRKRLLALGRGAPFALLRRAAADPGPELAQPAAPGPPGAAVGPQVHAAARLAGGAATVALLDYAPARGAALPPSAPSQREHWTDYVDYWSVDFEPRGARFHHHWWTFRAPHRPLLPTVTAPHTYPAGAPPRVVLRVIDVFGTETTCALDLRRDDEPAAGACQAGGS